MSIRIGGVPYGVGAPLLGGLEDAPGVELVREPPTAMIPALRAGTLDAALLSSVEAIRHPGYTIAGGLGIACKREIRSVRAFRRRGRKIRRVGCDRSSATTVSLLRLLLQHVHHAEVDGTPEFETIEPTRAPDELPHDLVMLIGDPGLEADAGDREVWDLGTEWVRWTGLPFVFALWVLRPGVDHDAVLPVLQRAREVGRQRGAVDGTEGAAHYELDDQDLVGLRRFWTECRALGIGTEPDPEFVTP
ncbi:MAG: menaquinone biosynthetic enzyme MqnA/MqnD family protein [Planctomycetota bacterium]